MIVFVCDLCYAARDLEMVSVTHSERSEFSDSQSLRTFPNSATGLFTLLKKRVSLRVGSIGFSVSIDRPDYAKVGRFSVDRKN
jgi:hypothetical protein